MKISRYVFGAKLMALVALLCITMDCAAITPLLEADFSWKNTSVSGKRMSVYSIFMDSNNIAWLGTNNGLFFYDGVTTHAVSEDEITRNKVYSIIEDDGTLLLGTNRGVMKYTSRTNDFHYVTPKDSIREVRCLLRIGDELWMGGIYGMYTYNLKSRETKKSLSRSAAQICLLYS